MRALVSVYDKTGIVEFCTKLKELNIEIISTGGTSKLLSENKIAHIPVEEITKNKEAFGGRMKTISFEMMSSILFRRNHVNDIQEAKDLGIMPIDLVVCNLYDFAKTLNSDASLEQKIELIDIGGPTMIRSAAKNFHDVCVLTDPSDYNSFFNHIDSNGKVNLDFKKQCSLKAFKMTASYDLMISNEFSKLFDETPSLHFSENLQTLRYGENPHQKAKIFQLNNSLSNQTLANSKVLSGKEVSYNNYLDSDVAFKATSELKLVLPDYYSTVIVKHGTPCGISSSKNTLESLTTAWNVDSTSAFGGIIAFNFEVDKKCAEFFTDKFVEVILAPSFTKDAFEILTSKKNLRLIELPLKGRDQKELVVRSIFGGVLVQEEDEILASNIEFRNQTKNEIKTTNKDTMLFGQTIIKYLKSNCLALVSGNQTTLKITASGVGQPNRIECLTKLIAPKIADADLSEDILFSDAFFPFSDSIIEANKFGIKNIVSPGGSIKDKEVIATCNELNIAMSFTGVRNFRH